MTETPLPCHVTEEAVEAAAAEAYTLTEAQQLLRTGRLEARKLLKERDLLDEVKQAKASHYRATRRGEVD